MEQVGVIVLKNEPTAWVNSIVIVLNSNGKLHICIDLKDYHLEKTICRLHYPLKTVEDAIQRITEVKVFYKLDATSSFWQIGLTVEGSKLFTFNTSYGRYMFNGYHLT